MILFHIVILSLIQGITEFLPISSSGHLVLGHALLSGDIDNIAWKSDDVVLDVAVHFGTLLSVLIYFRHNLTKMVFSGLSALKIGTALPKTNVQDQGQGFYLMLYIVIASLPVIFAGFILHLFSPDWVRSVEIVAWATLIFGVLLGLADYKMPATKTLQSMNWKSALFIGFSQVLALIPGTSRSGITMTAGRFCGFKRTDCAEFSLYLAIIAIAGAATLSCIDLWQSGDAALGWDALIGMAISFISGWVAIAVMMKWLEKSSFLPFVIYRILLAGALFIAL